MEYLSEEYRVPPVLAQRLFDRGYWLLTFCVFDLGFTDTAVGRVVLQAHAVCDDFGGLVMVRGWQ